MILFLISSGSIVKSEALDISQKTGFAPIYFITFAVAANVSDGTKTSSSYFIPRANKDICKEAEHEDVVNENLVSNLSQNNFSNLSQFGPVEIHFESNVLLTASFSLLSKFKSNKGILYMFSYIIVLFTISNQIYKSYYEMY